MLYLLIFKQVGKEQDQFILWIIPRNQFKFLVTNTENKTKKNKNRKNFNARKTDQ